MEKIKKLAIDIRFYFVVLSLTAIWLMVKNGNLKNEISRTSLEKDSFKKERDSLNQEIFVKDIIIGSYEVMWGRLQEIDPELANKIDLEVE